MSEIKTVEIIVESAIKTVEVAGSNAVQVVEILVPGIQGPAGADGATGPQGIQGPAGIAGATGPQGIQGPAGADGATGPQGIQGPAGIAGADGAIGPQGIQGPAGSGTPWESTTINITDFKGVYDYEEIIAAPGIATTDFISLMLAPTTDNDENAPEGMSLQSLYAIAGTDNFTLRIAFNELTSGPIKLLWRI